jgi:hypothetical protein
MDQRTRDNWLKVKVALEAAGKTDSYFYKRAAAIIKTGVDPDAGSLPNKM